MATLVLGAVGSAVGGALLPGGVSILGTTLTGAALGGALGSIGGSIVDQALLGPLASSSGQTRIDQGPRLFDLKLGASSEGAPLPRIYGPVAGGARFILINSAVTPVNLRPDEVGLALNYKFGPASESLDEPSYGAEAHAFQGLGLRPLAPARLQGKRNPGSGDWTFLLTRRARIGGDSWAGLEVPLGEEQELYQLEILDAPGGDVLRSIEVTAPSYLYTAAMQTADFGATQWNMSIRVAQVSPSYGPGVASEQLTWDYQH